MQIYKIYVPRKDYVKAKNLTIMIYNIERPQHLDISDVKYERDLAQRIRQRYTEHQGLKPLLDILIEYYNEIKKEGN